MPTSTITTRKTQNVPLADQLRYAPYIRESILRRMQLGAAAADSNVFTYSSAMIPNLLRHIHFSDQLAVFFVEQGFTPKPRGASIFLSKYCDVSQSIVELRMMRGVRSSSGEFDLFEVNTKTDNLAFRIARNYRDSDTVPSLFPMEELIRIGAIEFTTYSKENTLILFWDTNGSNDLMNGEQIDLYLTRPVSIDEGKELIQTYWIESIGSFHPVSLPSAGIDPMDLPVAPALEPQVTPRVVTQPATTGDTAARG